MNFPHSFIEQQYRQRLMKEVRQYDASLEPWLRAEYRNSADAEQAFTLYKQARQPKYSLWSRLKSIFMIFKFDMNFTQKSIEEYLSKSRDHYDLEEREKQIMRGNLRLA